MIYSKCKRYYKYRLEETFEFQLRRYGIKDCFCKTPFIELTGGRIIIKKGYAWDGASGPTIDTKSSMKASLVHDALYQLIRLKLLPFSYKAIADKNFYNICLQDGMWKWRAKLWYKVVANFADYAAEPKKRKILIAP